MSSSELVREGSCLCGKVQLRLRGEPVQKVLCHCLSCQKSCGAIFMSNLFCTKESVEIEDPESVIGHYDDSSCDSGSTVRRSFCSSCGSNLHITNLKNPAIMGYIIIPMGLMNCPKDDLKPQNEYYVKRRVGWYPGVGDSKEFQSMT